MNFIKIPKQDFLMGTNNTKRVFPENHETPQTKIHIDTFLIGDTPVTNADFKKFVDETGYISEAEAAGWSFVFHLFLSEKAKNAPKHPQLPWWRIVEGADWKHPFGPGSSIQNMMDYPVVHVSRNDALVYCKWSKTRLPSEAEWECAARGGRQNQRYPWGNKMLENNKYHANFWQGDHTKTYCVDKKLDGYSGLAPVHAFEPNDYGLYQVIGNVWEWCSNPRGILLNEFIHKDGKKFWEENNFYSENQYSEKGGCYLCVDPHCSRRDGTTANSTTGSLSFRVVKDII